MDGTLSQEIVVGVALVLIGAAVSQIWTRVQTRLVKLHWTATHNPMGTSEEHPQIGSVEVRYNGVPVRSVYVTTVQIQNPSTRDLQNVVLNFEVDERSVILHSIARVLGSIPELSFTQQFSDGAKAALNHDMPNPVDVVYYDRHRDYLVPVFNRGAVVHAGFLISRDDGSQPFIVTTCDHSGVKLVFRALAQSTLGVSNRQAQVIGLIASLGLTIVVAYVTPNIWTGSVFGWISGLFALLIGAVLIRFGRLMMGLFG